MIQDPGQTQEANLAWLYIVGAVIMGVNGWMTHAQSVKAYNDEIEGE